MPFINDRLADTAPPSLQAGSRWQSLKEARELLKSQIIGQDEAVEVVVRVLALVRANLRADGRPWATVLLAGKTGVGKTELVRQTAALVRSGPDDMCRIDMGALAQEHYAASFAGAPPGYSGSKEGHSLFERSAVEGDTMTPGIVLFDEVEKAHGAVLRALLQVLDHGEMRLANGQETLRFHNTIVFMTSNLGARELDGRLLRAARRLADQQHRLAFVPGRHHALAAIHRWERTLTRDAVRDFFDPEFLNRIDEIVHLDGLDSESATTVAWLRVGDLQRQLRSRDVTLTVDPSVVARLVEEGFDAAYGGRSVRRAVRKLLTVPVARTMADRRPGSPKPAELRAMITAGHIEIEVVSHHPDVRDQRGASTSVPPSPPSPV